MLSLLLVAISVFQAWRYSKTTIDPDLAMFTLWGITGSAYGRDFVDCKTPGVHLYYLLLSKVVGRDIERIRFANHLLMGLGGVLIYAVSGNFYYGLAFTVLVNSGFLYAFHGNVGQIPALLIALGLIVRNEWLSLILFTLAVGYEPKLLPSFGILMVLNGWYLPAAIMLIIGTAAFLALRKLPWFQWIWESSVIIPVRMAKTAQGKYPYMPFFTANCLAYFLPWVLLAVLTRPDWRFWIPAAAYVIFISIGRVIRPNHLLPLVGWVAVSCSPTTAVVLTLVDWAAAGLYLGNIWMRFYPRLEMHNDHAMRAGEWLKDKPGKLWVNDIHSGVYIYAGKPVAYGLAEQVEIRDVATERRQAWRKRMKADMPEWIAQGPYPGWDFRGVGYQQVAATKGSGYQIWKKE
jgi:hypothetical protein